jgi:ParB family chromosome partitioning protein
MKKLDELTRTLGANVGQSVGLGREPGRLPPGINPSQAVRPSAREQGVFRSKDTLVIPTDKIQPDPDQPREEFEPESLARLAESLKTRGQLQPVRVRWDESAGAYVLLMGERRWRAAVQAGLSTMTAVVHEGDLSPGERLTVQLVENALREDLTPVEAAKAYRRLMEANGWSGNQLARELSLPQSAVAQTLAILKLPEDVQAQVEDGALSARSAYEISKLPDPAVQAELAELAVADGLTRDQVAETVKARKLGKAKAEPGGKREIKFDDGAKIVVTLPPGSDGGTAAVAELLQRGVKKLRAEMKQAQPGQAA